ncbi:MAG: hypothetical protein QOH56_4340 [Pseudonocardiales bacterium]|nr:hypothetical protein [Pseudonocardiales bacterium]
MSDIESGEVTPGPYNREVLVATLIYHWRKDIRGCGCGWAALGASHPEHVVDVYEESVAFTPRGGQHGNPDGGTR